jgi:hypothetical protein
MPDQEKYCVYTEKGRSMGCFPTREKAKTRLKQIEQFKHMGLNLSLDEIETRVNKLPLLSSRQFRITVRALKGSTK